MHILQLLDIGVFGPLARYCTQEVDTWTTIQPLHTSLLKEDLIPLCEKASKKHSLVLRFPLPGCNDPMIGSYNNYHLSPNGIPSGNRRWYGLVYLVYKNADSPGARPREQ